MDQLREELTKRGLDSKGKKDELQERLQSAIDKEMLDAIDEEDELAGGAEAAGEEALPPIPPAPAPAPAETQARKPSPVKVTATATAPPSFLGQAEAPIANSVPEVASSADEGQAELTEEEKKKRRAERFGIPLSEEEKKKNRAERFGLAPMAGAAGANAIAPAPALTAEEEERRRARAARFGLPDPKFEVGRRR